MSWFAVVIADCSSFSASTTHDSLPARRGGLPVTSTSSSSFAAQPPVAVYPLHRNGFALAIGQRRPLLPTAAVIADDKNAWMWASPYFGRHHPQLYVSLTLTRQGEENAVVQSVGVNPTFALRGDASASATATQRTPEVLRKGSSCVVSAQHAEQCYRQLAEDIGRLLTADQQSAVDASFAVGTKALEPLWSTPAAATTALDEHVLRWINRSNGSSGAVFCFPTHVKSEGSDASAFTTPRVFVLRVPTATTDAVVGLPSAPPKTTAAAAAGLSGLLQALDDLPEHDDEVDKPTGSSSTSAAEHMKRLSTMRLLDRALEEDGHQTRAPNVAVIPPPPFLNTKSPSSSSTVSAIPKKVDAEEEIVVAKVKTESKPSTPLPAAATRPFVAREVPEEEWMPVPRHAAPPPTPTTTTTKAPLNVVKKEATIPSSPKARTAGAGTAAVGTWEWKCHVNRKDSDNTAWRPYAKKDNDLLEQAYMHPNAKGIFAPIVALSGTHSVCFHDVHVGMAQYQTADPSKWRAVRRQTHSSDHRTAKASREEVPKGRRQVKRQRIVKDTGMSTDDDSSGSDGGSSVGSSFISEDDSDESDSDDESFDSSDSD